MKAKAASWALLLLCPFLVMAAPNDEYLLGTSDVVSISVWRQDDLRTEVTVGPNGEISFPLIGQMKVGGMTASQLQEEIARRLRKFIKKPVVTVTITGYHSRRVYVLGMVKNPGIQPLSGKDNLLEVLSSAGGPTESANLRKCSIIRGRNEIINIDLYQLLVKGNKELDISLQPEDTVYVPDNADNQVYVLGEVRNPGLYPIRGQFTLLDAVSSAGGWTDDAKIDQIKIIRGKEKEREVISLNMEKRSKGKEKGKMLMLQSDDIVFVPKRAMAKFNYYVEQLLPSIQTITLTDAAVGGH